MTRKILALVLATTAVAGCSLRGTDLRRGSTSAVMERIGIGSGGRVIEPKRCALKMVILPRPLRDKAVDSAVWATADEQVIAPEARRALEANGLRVGVITGGLPAEVESALNAPPPNKVDPAEFNLPDGDNTLVSLAEATPLATVILTRDGRASGKDYKDVSGFFRVTASHDGPTGVGLRIAPEIHHGPIQRRFDALPNSAGAMNTMQFGVKDGQQEETFRDLVAALTLQPGQIAVVGCDPDRRGSLGGYLFTQPEANSDRIIQKVLLIWASRSNPGEPGSQPKPPADLVPVEPPDLTGPARKDESASANPKAEGPKK
jgi:hypothetical protein